MSYPVCDARRMQSEDAAEPVEWDIAEFKRRIDEWEGIAAQIIRLLNESANAATSQNWRPHAGQITAVVTRFRDLCRRESRQLGWWRADGVTADEAYDSVWQQGDALVRWLNRMMQT